MEIFFKAALELLDVYRRTPDAEPLDFSRSSAYHQFVKVAEQAGFTGPDMEMDSEYSDRSPKWVAHADIDVLRCWVHTLIRADRWNADYPTAIMNACSSGCMSALTLRVLK